MTSFSVLADVITSAVPHPFAWNPHYEVWSVIVVPAAMYWYATRVIGPKAVPDGHPVVTRSQTYWFFSALLVIWIAAGWPLDDLSDSYLYGAHIVQHLLLTLVLPPMLLMATPEWLVRLVLGPRRSMAYRAYRFLTRPLVAGIIFNVVYLSSHAPWVVNETVKNESFHFSMHVVLTLAGLVMFSCVCGPLKELRLSLPSQCMYLMVMGILPTIPAAWMIFAPGVVYKAYVHRWPSLWGLTPMGDQELAGFIMKMVGGIYMGSIIVTLLFRWFRQDEQSEDRLRRTRDRERLEAHEVSR